MINANKWYNKLTSILCQLPMLFFIGMPATDNAWTIEIECETYIQLLRINFRSNLNELASRDSPH